VDHKKSGGSRTRFFVFLVINSFAAPYRIERDRRKALEAQMQKLGVQNAGSPFPDWTIHDLFYFINPAVLESTNDSLTPDPWQRVEVKIKDKASLGQLHVWGRRFDPSGMVEFIGDRKGLVRIPETFWEDANFSFSAIFSDAEQARYTAAHVTSGTTQYCDVMVNKQQALALWPDAPPEGDMHFVVDISVRGIAAILRQSITSGIEHITWEADKPRLRVLFHRPLQQDYTVEVLGDDTVFKTIIEKTAEFVTLELRGPGNVIFSARVTIKLLGTRLRPYVDRFRK
jgi:hypothetical protein